MKLSKFTGFLLIFMILTLVLAPAAMAKKDTLKIGFATKFSTLDHYKSTLRVTIQFGYMVWDPLVTRDPDTGKIYPGAAKSWKTINPTTWEFKLQPGIKFHNGNPLNAEAVRFTIEDWVLNPAIKSPQLGNFKWIKKVEVVDDLTFRLITEKPYPIVLERLNTLFVYDPVYCKQVGEEKVAVAPMGSGPYQFVKWDRGSRIVLKKNPNYWKKGLPKIPNVICRIVPEMSTRVAELISGGIDFALNFGPDMWDAVKKSKRCVPMDVPILRINFWQFDGSGLAAKGPLMDKRVRQAVWHAIDRKAIIKTVARGFAGELNAPMNPLQFGYDPSIKGYEYNPEKAKALLAEAGYPDGFTMNLWQYYGYQNHPNQAAMGYLNQVGIKVNLKDYRGNVGQLIKLRNTHKLSDVGNYTWGSYNIFDADAILPAWFMIKEKKCYNHDEELDKWLTEARYSVDPEERKALYAKAQKKIIDEAYWMPFFIVHSIMARDKNLNIIVGRDEVPRFNEAYWK